MRPSEIHERFDDHLAATLGASDRATSERWARSRHVYDRFGDDTDDLAPRCYAVGVLGSEFPANERGRRSEGLYTRTTVGVRFAVRLRGDNPHSDYRTALDAETDLIAAVHRMPTHGMSSVRLAAVPARQASEAGDWFTGEVQFDVAHTYTLRGVA